MNGRRSWLLRARRNARGLSRGTLVLQAVLLTAGLAVLVTMLRSGRAAAVLPTAAIAVLVACLLIAVLVELSRRR
ncbi:hypothetical protein [Saccharopolyspora griseoalba]|uniref:Uncharacterized protein n=1 Tax=Saccharopolyspora griseoalba TaxID=1431848 RepID=A0ABW2LKT9_9PSEU